MGIVNYIKNIDFGQERKYGGKASAKRYSVIRRRYEEFGFPLRITTDIIPDENSTLFVCSGMQKLKSKFLNPDKTSEGTLQSCIRTNDLDLVGDGTHLSYFEMLGNFSFGSNDYIRSIELWHSILKDLKISVDNVHIHPKSNHHNLWKERGYQIIEDIECEWSDGNIGGFCCEIYSNNIEIGNLVNTLGHSTDVGFGFERLIMILEGKNRVDETSLFDQSLSPIARDHVRTLNSFWENGIIPGNKGRNYVCRRIIRRVLEVEFNNIIWQEWLESERILRDKCVKNAKKLWKRFSDKPHEWWWQTCGITPEDLIFIKNG